MKKLLFTLLISLSALSTFGQANTKKWEKFFDGERLSEDLSYFSTTDETGITYLVGTSTYNANNAEALVVLKIAPDGTLLKEYRPNVLFNSNVKPTCIKAGKNGDFWIGANVGFRGALIKLNKDSVEWMRVLQYDQSQVNSIDIDESNNLYYGGSMDDNSTFFQKNFLTGKYNAAGDTVWNKPVLFSTQNDVVYSIAYKQNSLWSLGSISSDAVFTRQNVFDGSNIWSYTTAGLFTPGAGASDKSIFIDDTLNAHFAYTTSSSFGSTKYTQILKLDSNSISKWVYTYAGPNDKRSEAKSFLMDAAQQHIYIFGLTDVGNSTQLAIGKIQLGEQASMSWSTVIPTTGSEKQANTMFLSEGDNHIYGSFDAQVAGTQSNFGFSMDTAGVIQWTKTLPKPNLYQKPFVTGAVGLPNGDVRFTGHMAEGIHDYRLYALDYTAAGTFQDSTRYQQIGHGIDHSRAQHIDKYGNIHLVGESENISKGTFVTYRKMDANGTVLASFDVPGIFEAGHLGTDLAGNVYLTGRPPADYDSIVVVSFNPTGGILNWSTKLLENSTYSADKFPQIKVTDAGNVYITCNQFTTAEKMFTAKLNVNGVVQWTRRFAGHPSGVTQAGDIALDSDENVYVVGSTYYNATGYTMAWVKYDSDGNQLDSAIWLNGNPDPFELILDEDRNSHIGYNYKTFATGGVCKIDVNGELLWFKEYSDCAGIIHQLTDIELDKKGNVYAAGQGGECSTGDFMNHVTIKYDSTGNVAWKNVHTYPPKTMSLYPGALGVDSNMNVYSCFQGGFDAADVTKGFTLLKYDSLGNEIWSDIYTGRNEYAGYYYSPMRYLFHVYPGGELLFSGESQEKENGLDMFTVKYGLCTGTINGAINGPDRVCSGDSATFLATGGSAYQWTPSDFFADPNAASSKASFFGDTTIGVKVFDGSGCYASVFKKITISRVTSATSTIKSVSCAGLSDGSITVTSIIGDDAPFQINGSTNSTITNLPAGPFGITITNSAGCTYQFSSIISQPPPITVSTTKTDDNNHKKMGTATAEVNGGTPPYSYVWSDPMTQITKTATGLDSGTFYVKVTDANGCLDSGVVTLSNINVGIDENSAAHSIQTGRLNDALFINLNSNSAVLGSFTIISLDGKQLISVENTAIQKGEQLIQVDASKLAAGIYVLQWKLGNEQGAVKFVW